MSADEHLKTRVPRKRRERGKSCSASRPARATCQTSHSACLRRSRPAGTADAQARRRMKNRLERGICTLRHFRACQDTLPSRHGTVCWCTNVLGRHVPGPRQPVVRDVRRRPGSPSSETCAARPGSPSVSRRARAHPMSPSVSRRAPHSSGAVSKHDADDSNDSHLYQSTHAVCRRTSIKYRQARSLAGKQIAASRSHTSRARIPA